MTFLSDILARKEREIASLPLMRVPASRRRSLVRAVLGRRPSLIAEVKPVSPSLGRLLERGDVPAVVGLYNRYAQAISVLCDGPAFGGGFDLLASIRTLTDLPLLAKDFILDGRQIDAAAAHGADAVLLIASILNEKELRPLACHAITSGLDVLLELHDTRDVDAAAAVIHSLPEERRGHLLLGINNRDLRTQETDLRTTELLAGLLRDRVPAMRAVIAESGIAVPGDVRRLAPFVQGFLIGTSLLQARDSSPFLSCFSPS